MLACDEVFDDMLALARERFQKLEQRVKSLEGELVSLRQLVAGQLRGEPKDLGDKNCVILEEGSSCCE